jgi:formiminoglutamase
MEKKSIGNFPLAFRIVGFPDELGIENVKGRVGAKHGPQAFTEAFLKVNGRVAVREGMLSPVMVSMGHQIEENYRGASLAVKESHAKSEFVIGVGGGHDYAYAWIKGLAEAFPKKRIGCINLDAHFDLRDYSGGMTSGSPFRRLIDEKILKGPNLIEFGIQDHCNVPELWKYARKNKVKIIEFEKLRNGKALTQFKLALTALRKNCDVIFLSVDLDAMSVAFCPGVSAPQGEGFTGGELYQMLEIAGADRKVASLGIFELSPPLDQAGYTSKVAAQAAWHFLSRRIGMNKKN